MLQTAVIVPVPEAEPVLSAWRELAGADPPAARLPAHVTLVVPVVPAAEVDGAVVDQLRALTTETAAFDFELREARRFPAALYLAPEPSAPFVRLTEALVALCPQHPPYGGAFVSIVPHVTVAEGPAPVLDAAASAVAPLLPVVCAARHGT